MREQVRETEKRRTPRLDERLDVDGRLPSQVDAMEDQFCCNDLLASEPCATRSWSLINEKADSQHSW